MQFTEDDGKRRTGFLNMPYHSCHGKAVTVTRFFPMGKAYVLVEGDKDPWPVDTSWIVDAKPTSPTKSYHDYLRGN